MRRVWFILSIPERLLRALVAVVGGGIVVLSAMLVPDVIKRTTLYRILLGDGLRFAVERVAGVTPVTGSGQPPLPDDYQLRKLAGTAIESLGVIAVQFSPLWVFAIAGDAAAGSKLFLHRLEEHLKREGVIAPDAEVRELTDLLDAVQQASRATAMVIDTPPLSRRELEQLAADLKASYREVFRGSVDILPRLDQLWAGMQRIASEKQIPLRQVTRLMARGARTWFDKGRGAVRALGRTGSDLAGEQILQGYQRTLEEIGAQGTRAYLHLRYTPYLEAASDQLRPDQTSWTESRLSERFP